MVVTFGEIMMRLSPPNFGRLMQTNSFNSYFGGGEANVSIALSQFNTNTRFVTVLPDNDIGKACRNEVRKWGVDTNSIVWGGERLGIYFCENGASQRSSKVVYDRKNSAISVADPSVYNWEKIFSGASWFHFSGITPALSGNAAKATLHAIKCAKKMGLTVSCDLNYRRTLWTEEEACKTMSEMMPFVDVLITNEYQLDDVFGVKQNNLTDNEKYRYLASEVKKKFGISTVAMTIRNSVSASVNEISAVYCKGNNIYTSNEYSVQIVDRVGGGDAFAAGLIYAIQNGFSDEEQINFAMAASCIKHSVEGDFLVATADEVMALMQGNGSGLIQR